MMLAWIIGGIGLVLVLLGLVAFATRFIPSPAEWTDTRRVRSDLAAEDIGIALLTCGAAILAVALLTGGAHL